MRSDFSLNNNQKNISSENKNLLYWLQNPVEKHWEIDDLRKYVLKILMKNIGKEILLLGSSEGHIILKRVKISMV